MMFKKLHYMKRLEEILTVFFEEGFGAMVTRARLHYHVPLLHRMKHTLRASQNGSEAKRLCRALEKLGPTFVKLGQALSLRPDVLPKENITALEEMQDKVPPVSFEEIKVVVEQQLGKKIEQV